MNNKLLNVLFILFILFISAIVSGCNFHKKIVQVPEYKHITLDEQQEQNANIRTEILQNRPIQLRITIPAKFEPVAKFLDRTYAPINGKITKIFVGIGDIVRVGQPLIEIKSDIIGQIQLEFLDSYIIVDSEIAQMKAQYNLSMNAYKRENILYHEGISSRAEYDVAKAQMLKDRINLHSLQTKENAIKKVYAQRIALYGGNEGTILEAVRTKKIYPYIILRANKRGIVLVRKVNTGEVIAQDQELFNIADLSMIWLVGFAFEKDVPFLKVGQNITGVLEEQPSKHIKGKLSYVASILDPESRTLTVIADVPNKDFSIKPNTYSEMVVDTGIINTLAAPNTALQKYGDYTFAYVKVAPHTYEERKVELGQSNNKYTEIKSGLKQGEEIVSNGSFSLLGESIKKKEEF